MKSTIHFILLVMMSLNCTSIYGQQLTMQTDLDKECQSRMLDQILDSDFDKLSDKSKKIVCKHLEAIWRLILHPRCLIML